MIERVDADAYRMAGALVACFGGWLVSGIATAPFVAAAAILLVAAIIGFGWRMIAGRRLWRGIFPSRHATELFDQVAVVPGRLLLPRFEPFEDRLDAIDRGKDERHGLGRDRHAVAELAHQRLGGVGERLKPRQREKAASAFDGVDEAKNVAEDLSVIRLVLESHKLGVDQVAALAGFGQKIP